MRDVTGPASDEQVIALLTTYGAALRRLSRVYARNPADQDDLFQEIAVAIWRSLPGFRGDASERTWVYRVAHNVASTFRARNRRAQAAGQLPAAAADHACAPGSGAQPERRDDRLDLVDLVRRLPPLDRQIVSLYLEGLTAVEIGAVTGLSATNVAVRLTRARKALQHAATQPGSPP
jgi:RNA polymerase sigma-70 factor (ECF subfamily)